MRIRDHRADDEPEINLVPMIDVILVLIIFFVVTATFDARSVIQLELPRATGEQSEAEQPLVVLVNADGVTSSMTARSCGPTWARSRQRLPKLPATSAIVR